MFSDYLLSQFLASAAIIIGAAAYLEKRDRHLKLLLSAAAICQAFHFFYLGAAQGAAQASVTAMRFFVSAWWQHKMMFWLFILGGTAIGCWRYQSAVDFLPIMANFVACIAVFRRRGIEMRYGLLFVTILWFFYNFLYSSLAGCLLEVFYFFVNAAAVRKIRSANY